MQERLLQYIWQHGYFRQHDLVTTTGERIVILKPGTWNHHQGPDFSAATIRIGQTTWVGNVEIHLRSGDWHKHHHTHDAQYGNIILHVVWEEDQLIKDANHLPIPTLVIAPYVPKILLEKYQQLTNTLVKIPCYHQLPVLTELGWFSWKERLAVERLQRKAEQVLQQLQQSNTHWEEVLWWQLAANFGIKVNSVVFEQVAKSIPFNMILRHRNRPDQLEAMLFGQANLLEQKIRDPYYQALQQEYRFLQKKYRLIPVKATPVFLRMRPAAFPTVRLAQLAKLMYASEHLFDQICRETALQNVLDLFAVTASDYWQKHYMFNQPVQRAAPGLGKQMQQNLLINTVIPLLFAYGLHTQQRILKEKVIQWLYLLPPESNTLTRFWQQAEVGNRCALDSQALLELSSQYCQPKKCLDCAVGNKIVKTGV